MKILTIQKLLVIILLSGSFTATASRTQTNIDFDWYFHLGDIKEGEKLMDYASWRQLDVPHDWSIEQSYDKNVAGHHANAFLPAGIGWYKKEIEWSDAWSNKLVFIDFDGVYMKSTVWVNGQQVGYRPNGYLSLFYELTPHLKRGKNVISVKVDNVLQPSARWYTGNGIYRHVNLVVTDKIRVEKDGTYVTTPKISKEQATVKFEVEVDNRLPESYAQIISIVLDAQGQEVARVAERAKLTNGANRISGQIEVANPLLWSTETPHLYTLKTVIEKNGEILDEYPTSFGIRKIEYDPTFGFKLNGVNTKMKGVCLHQNTGPFGIAMPDDAWQKRLTMLKEMGCNAIRTSHYPYSPVFYQLCDQMGFLVMDEPWDGWLQWTKNGKARYDYSYYFLDWWQQDLEEFIKRDRNHPSIVMWCMGNEVWRFEKHMYVQALINDTFHRLDPSRPTTQAWALGEHLDVAGFNANGEGRYDLADFHKSQPNKLAIGTEIPHTRQTRGVYRTKTSYMPWDVPDNSGQETSAANLDRLFPLPDLTDEEVFTGVDLRYASGYDNQTRKISCRDQWIQTRDNYFFMGEFRWTAFDYLGESWGWPARTNNYGIIDMADFPKDAFYLYQSFWATKPMVHLLPHWTHPGKEGVAIPVVVYTNGDEAELLFNGKSLGRKQMDQNVLQIVWNVPYKAGTLTAIAYKKGKICARKSVSTATEPARIQLTANRCEASANRRDVIYLTVDILDAKGNLVPAADNLVEFEVSGSYKLLGVENGDILDLNPAKSTQSKAFMGKTLLVLQTTDQAGILTVTAHSTGLKSDQQIVKINKRL
ncbi:MAG: glycoside hydrolase family 2 TIM barrel-domain containing protein [Alistipes sp.]